MYIESYRLISVDYNLINFDLVAIIHDPTP